MFVSIIPVSRLSLSLSIGQSDNPPHLFLSCLRCGLLFLSTLWPCAKWWTMVAMAMCNWPHAIWRFYRSRIICSTQPTAVPWHSLAVCVCVCFTCVTDVCIRSVCSNILCYSQGLAMESLEANKLLWKSRPKHHKLLGSKVAMMIHNTSPVKYDLSRFLLLYDHFLSKARPSGLRCCSPDQSHQTQLLHGRRRGWKIEKISDGQQPPKHGRICS